MAQQFVESKIHPGKVVVFIKPTCPYCSRAKEILYRWCFKQGLLEFVDITAAADTNAVQDYLGKRTGARTVPRVFLGTDCIGGCSELVTLQESGELSNRLADLGVLEKCS